MVKRGVISSFWMCTFRDQFLVVLSLFGPSLSADFTATFTGSCGDCTNQSFPVTATR